MSHSYSNTLPVNMSDQVSQSSRLWNIIGQKMPRNEIVYFTTGVHA